MTAPAVENPACPRCAYDLSGAAGVRAESETGTCSECGLTFLWRDVLDPDRTVPRWFVERAYSWFVRNAVSTALRASFAPWRFWQAVMMHLPMRAGRLIAFVAFMLVLTHLAVGVVPLLDALQPDPLGIRGPMTPRAAAGELVGIVVNPYTFEYYARPRRFGPLSITFDTPRTFSRTALFGIALFGVMPLVPLLLRQTMRQFKVRTAHIWRIAAYTLSPLPILVVMHGAATYFSAALSYRGFSPSLIGELLQSLSVVYNIMDQVIPLRHFALALHVAWLGLAWYFAISRYLRIPHAAGVTVAALIVGILIVVLLGVAIQLTFPSWHEAWRRF